MDEQTLTKIRTLEGQMDIPEHKRLFFTRERKEPCVFAEVINHTCEKLFYCTYKKKCDNQRQYGTKTLYCEKTFYEHPVNLREIMIEKYGEEQVRSMEDRI